MRDGATTRENDENHLNHSSVDVTVIGAGQAGLAVSYLLNEAEIRHVVLERGEVGESWRSQRWDSFRLNTPNWTNSLPGMEFDPGQPDAFPSHRELVSYFERYVETFGLPVKTHTEVTHLERHPDVGYRVQFDNAVLRSHSVVLASGGAHRPSVPRMSERLSPEVASISAADYRNPATLPDGAVVVVGTGQSGCQIAEDLLEAGREVYLCASRVARCPRRYRGRDILEWLDDLGILDMRPDDLEDPEEQYAPQPQISGTDGGHTLSLQLLARKGATLLGRVTDARDQTLALGDNLKECIAFADDRSAFFKEAIDKWIAHRGIDAPPPGDDPGEPRMSDLEGLDHLARLDLAEAGVGTVIWCTGFNADWRWVKVDVFDDDGRPLHKEGITDEPGLYFVGLPWLSKRKSGLLLGVAEDASRVADHIKDGLKTRPMP